MDLFGQSAVPPLTRATPYQLFNSSATAPSPPRRSRLRCLMGLGLSAWACGPAWGPERVRGVEARHRCVLGLRGGGPKGGGRPKTQPKPKTHPKTHWANTCSEAQIPITHVARQARPKNRQTPKWQRKIQFMSRRQPKCSRNVDPRTGSSRKCMIQELAKTELASKSWTKSEPASKKRCKQD